MYVLYVYTYKYIRMYIYIYIYTCKIDQHNHVGIDQRYEIHIEISYVAARSVETSTDPVAFKRCEHEKDLLEPLATPCDR